MTDPIICTVCLKKMRAKFIISLRRHPNTLINRRNHLYLKLIQIILGFALKFHVLAIALLQ